MNRISPFKITLLITTCCLSCNTSELKTAQLEIQRLHQEKDSLITLNESMQKDIEYLKQFEPRRLIRQLTDKEAISLFLDHQKFYCQDYDYKNLKVKKVNDHEYHISYSWMNVGDPHVVKEWTSGVSKLTIQIGDKYSITLINGPLCG